MEAEAKPEGSSKLFEREVGPVILVRVRVSATSLSAQGLSVLTQLPVIDSFWDSEAGPPFPQSREMEASWYWELKLMAKWAPLNDTDDLLVKPPENPSLMPRFAPLAPVWSDPQRNFLVPKS